MASNLCIDIGNSRIKLAVLEKDSVKHFALFEHNKESELLTWLSDKVFDKGIYSSVLKLIPEWLVLLNKHYNLLKLHAGLKTPLKITYNTPESLGSDRIAAMVGAIDKYPNDPVLVVNAGTCVTYDLVNKQHEFVGGNIAPGLDLRWKAMHEFTSSLPRIKEAIPPTTLLGNNTISALHNGGLEGIVLEIEGYFGRLQPDFPDLKCIITGGSAPYLVNSLKIGNFAEPYLVLKGLNTILNYQ